jgi:RNA polymerase sigma-70 factor (ECF subfamily)
VTAPTPADLAAFDEVRPRLFGIAYRVLGNRSDADDVVQDAWIRWQYADRAEVRDAAAFLATTTTRLALNVKQSARARRVTYIGAALPDTVDADADPARDAEHGDALERGMGLLLEKLTPAERAVYVLREAFDYPYRQIAELLALSEANARQLLTRARRRLSGDHRRPVAGAEQERLLDAFVAAAQTGTIAALEGLLAADATARRSSAPGGLAAAPCAS